MVAPGPDLDDGHENGQELRSKGMGERVQPRGTALAQVPHRRLLIVVLLLHSHKQGIQGQSRTQLPLMNVHTLGDAHHQAFAASQCHCSITASATEPGTVPATVAATDLPLPLPL